MPGFSYPKNSLVISINADSFVEFINAYNHAVIHFGATWNGYDHMLVPVLAEAAIRLQNKVRFAVLDVDQNQSFCMDHNVLNVPFIEYYVGGKLRESCIGYNSAIKTSKNKIQPTVALLDRLMNEFGASPS